MSEPAVRPSEGQAKEVFWTAPQGALIGRSSDTKPTTDDRGAPLKPGVEFYEFDTDRRFKWDGTDWAPRATAATLAALANKLDQLVTAQAEANSLLRRLVWGAMSWLDEELPDPGPDF